MPHGPELYRMAWRNLWRNRRRTIITLSSLAFGVLTAVTFTAITDQSLGDAIDLAARMSNGHVTIEARGYRDSPTLERSIVADAKLRAALSAERPDEETQLALYIRDQRRAEAVARRLRALLPSGAAALGWAEVNPDLAGFVTVKVVSSEVIELSRSYERTSAGSSDRPKIQLSWWSKRSTTCNASSLAPSKTSRTRSPKRRSSCRSWSARSNMRATGISARSWL